MGEAKERAVRAEAPREALGDDLEGGLAVSMVELVSELPGGVLVRELEDRGAVLLDAHDRDGSAGENAPHGRPARQSSKKRHTKSPARTLPAPARAGPQPGALGRALAHSCSLQPRMIREIRGGCKLDSLGPRLPRKLSVELELIVGISSMVAWKTRANGRTS
jgi:hypothetical protein